MASWAAPSTAAASRLRFARYHDPGRPALPENPHLQLPQEPLAQGTQQLPRTVRTGHTHGRL
ncbi:unnamed protein product, partial [Heterosigma akashiwo]